MSHIRGTTKCQAHDATSFNLFTGLSSAISNCSASAGLQDGKPQFLLPHRNNKDLSAFATTTGLNKAGISAGLPLTVNFAPSEKNFNNVAFWISLTSLGRREDLVLNAAGFYMILLRGRLHTQVPTVSVASLVEFSRNKGLPLGPLWKHEPMKNLPSAPNPSTLNNECNEFPTEALFQNPLPSLQVKKH